MRFRNRLQEIAFGIAIMLMGIFAPEHAFAQFDDDFDDTEEVPAPPAAETPAEKSEESAAAPANEVPAPPADTKTESKSPLVSDPTGFDDAFEGDLDRSNTPEPTNHVEIESGAEESALVENKSSDVDVDRARAKRAGEMRTHNTYFGASGGLHVVDAGSGPVGSLRAQLLTDFFFTNDFLLEGDSSQGIGGVLSISGTVWDYLEISGAVQAFARFNDLGDPDLLQTLGDAHLNLKAFYPITDYLTIGGDVSVSLLNSVGDIGVVFDSTSVGLRANLAADFRKLNGSGFPLLARLNIQYYLDNSANLIEDTEAKRYTGLAEPEAEINEHRHLATRVERFGLNVNRVDTLRLGVGLEAPLRIHEDWFIHPLAEWTWHIPVNRQDYDCLYRPDPLDGSEPVGGRYGDDGCLAEQGISAYPMNVTLGFRVLPSVAGLSFLAAADVALTGKSTFVRELAPTPPYKVYLGVSYAYDTTPIPPAPIIKEIEKEQKVEVANTTSFHAKVLEEGNDMPITGAVIRFVGKELSAVVTDEVGHFVSYPFEAGTVNMEVSHPDYHPGTCSVDVSVDTPMDDTICKLAALPRHGSVVGRVTNDKGGVAEAKLKLTGPSTHEITSNAQGVFEIPRLEPGRYDVRIDAPKHLIRVTKFEVLPREQAQPEILLIPKPRRSLVKVRKNKIIIKRQIHFVTNSAEILEDSEALMTEIADVLLRTPEILQVEIQGHTDNRGGKDYNQELSQKRAEAVQNWLVAHGVETSRLSAAGYGQNKPLVPNITRRNRAKNRRVQFVIKERMKK